MEIYILYHAIYKATLTAAAAAATTTTTTTTTTAATTTTKTICHFHRHNRRTATIRIHVTLN